MGEATRNITIICPICNAKKTVPVPCEIVQNKETGSASVYIPSGLICEHEFYAYIDKNFAVRDYLALDYSKATDSFETKKREILNKCDDFDFTLDNVLKYIEEKDFRSLLYACFLETPIILIENNPDQDRFIIPYLLLSKLFPQMLKKIYVFPKERYLEIEKEQADQLEIFTVYNTMFKLSVRKPFTDSDSESFGEVLKILREGNPKLQIVYAKNWVDYLRKFAPEVANLNDKMDKLLKKLKKKYERQAHMFTTTTIPIMKHYVNMQKRIAMSNLISDL